MPDDLGLPPIDPTSSEYIYIQLADHITALISAGRLKPGARLPGERDLAQEYGVSLDSARRAIQVLRERKLVITKPSKGTFIL